MDRKRKRSPCDASDDAAGVSPKRQRTPEEESDFQWEPSSSSDSPSVDSDSTDSDSSEPHTSQASSHSRGQKRKAEDDPDEENNTPAVDQKRSKPTQSQDQEINTIFDLLNNRKHRMASLWARRDEPFFFTGDEEVRQVLRLRCPSDMLLFMSKYPVLDKISAGVFGAVFAGVRTSDRLKVAIKCVPSFAVKYTKFTNEFDIEWEIPLEVVNLLRAGGDHTCIGQKHAVSLVEWYDLGTHLLIVMERPDPCMNLRDFIDKNWQTAVTEEEAKNIIRQVIEAIQEMSCSFVFHRDLKPSNILVQPSDDGHKVRIVDFGCSCERQLLHRDFAGTFSYAPPEYFAYNTCFSSPTDVWQVGALLYELLTGDYFSTRQYMESPRIRFKQEPSQNCQDFLRACLQVKRSDRIKMAQLLSQPWFSRNTGATGPLCATGDSTFPDLTAL